MLWQQVRSRTGAAGGSPQTGSDADEAPKRAPPSTPVKAKQVDSPMAPLLAGDPKHHGSHARGRRWRQALMLGVGTVLLLLWFSSWDTPIDLSQDTFVKVDGIQFEHQCRPYYVAGFNVDNVAQAPIPAVARKMRGVGFNGRRMVRQLMREAAAAGLNAMRTWAHTTDPVYPMQIQPGEYDEGVLRGLDYVIAEAGRSGIKTILSFVDNWKYAGGVDEYVDWSPNVPKRDSRYPPINKLGDVTVEEYGPERLKYENLRKVHFFNDTHCKDMYRNHVQTILTRVNYYTGVAYKDDPTIMALNLVNEPRCSSAETPECPTLLNNWIRDMTAFVRSLDKNHLLTVGSEGFWGPSDPLKKMNPGMPKSDWASKTGQDFATNQGMTDFLSVHLWPDNWQTHNATFQREWLEKHIEEAETKLKKPIMLQEFGKILGRGQNPPPAAIKKHRDPVFALVNNVTERALSRPVHALVGSMFWRWGFNVYVKDYPGPYGVLPEHSTFELVTDHAQRVKRFMNTRPPKAECQLQCWVPKTGVYGLLNTCENRPAVCQELHAKRSHPPASQSSRLEAPQGAPEVFTTQRDCCRPGLGAFPNGCTTTWL